MTKKTRIINNLSALSEEEKETVISFFSVNPVYESRIDWNNKSLTYSDFKKVIETAGNSKNNKKRQSKKDPEILFNGYKHRVVSKTDDYLIVMPLDWKCAVYMNSFNCGGVGAKWCIGEKDNFNHWNRYVSKENLFYLIIFTKTHIFYGKKIIIEYNKFFDYFLTYDEKNRCFGKSFYKSNKLIKKINKKRFSNGKMLNRNYEIFGSDLLLWYYFLVLQEKENKQLFFNFDIFENLNEKLLHACNIMAVNGPIHNALKFDTEHLKKRDAPKKAPLFDPEYSFDFISKNYIKLKKDCITYKKIYEKLTEKYNKYKLEFLGYIYNIYEKSDENNRILLEQKISKIDKEISDVELEKTKIDDELVFGYGIQI